MSRHVCGQVFFQMVVPLTNIMEDMPENCTIDALKEVLNTAPL